MKTFTYVSKGLYDVVFNHTTLRLSKEGQRLGPTPTTPLFLKSSWDQGGLPA